MHMIADNITQNIHRKISVYLPSNATILIFSTNLNYFCIISIIQQLKLNTVTQDSSNLSFCFIRLLKTTHLIVAKVDGKITTQLLIATLWNFIKKGTILLQ